MPDKPAQHELRNWFEEPPRANQIAGSDGDPDGGAATTDPGTNGAATNGTATNGTATNGAATTDPGTNGAGTDGARTRTPETAEPLTTAAADPVGADPVDVDPVDVDPVDVDPVDTETAEPPTDNPARPGTAEATVSMVRPESGQSRNVSAAAPPADLDAPEPARATPDTADDPEATVVIPIIPVISDQPRPSGQPEPRPPAGIDSAVTAEIPRISIDTTTADWPTDDLGKPQIPPPEWRPPGQPPSPPPPSESAKSGDSGGRARLPGRGWIVAAAVLGLLVLVYGIDLALSQGEVPRGVTVAGVDVGGLDRVAAEQRLHEQIEPRLTRPLTVRAGDVETTLDPAQAGLTLDWPKTLDQVGEQPLNPWTRLVSLFTTREVGVVTSGDRETLSAALAGLRSQIDREPVEGTIRFEGVTPTPVDPVPGQRLDVPEATKVLLNNWAQGGVVQLPITTVPVRTTPDGIRHTLRTVVEPAVSSPITVTGEGADAVLEPEITAAALRFAPNENGSLAVTIDNPTVIEALTPQLTETEQVGEDATIVIEGGQPVVKPSVEGRQIDWDKSLKPLLDVLRKADAERALPAVYVTTPPKLTTERAQQLGIVTEISTFTTGGFASDSGQNIRRVAEQVNGAIVQPGETFSLNGYTGPRNAASGYVEAGIIEHGRPSRGIGGGVSQFATTLYNASYFAGMVDVEHKEHSYYISRYPAGREATVFEGAIDVKFRNDSPTGILIQTGWTPSSVTVTFWGTKHVEVESITGPRTNFTSPETRVIDDEPCTSTRGSKGFTVTDTRVIRDADSGAEISRETRTVVYRPQPQVICR